MSKHIMINGATPSFQLADSVDLDQLRQQVQKALQSGSVLELPVMLAEYGGEPTTLLLNGQAVASVAFAEL